MATTEREVPPLLDDQSTPVAKEKKRKNWVGLSWKPATEPGLDSCPLIGVDAQAKAIGAGSEGAQSALAEAYSKDMTLEEAEALLLGTLKQVMEEKISTENVELARVTEERGYHGATAEEVGAVLERL